MIWGSAWTHPPGSSPYLSEILSCSKLQVTTVPGELPGVTLACEGQGGTPAHKVVLTSTSTMKPSKSYRDSSIQKKYSEGCEGLCKRASHLKLNTIHTHKWRPRPRSHLTAKVRPMSELGMGYDMSDMERFAYNQDWLSVEGQEELRSSEDTTWGEVLWCQTCPSTMIYKQEVGQGLRWKEDGRVVSKEVGFRWKERRGAVRWEEGMEEWMGALWERVGEEVHHEHVEDMEPEVENEEHLEPEVKEQEHLEPEVKEHLEPEVKEQEHLEPEVMEHLEPEVKEHLEPGVEQEHLEPEVEQEHLEPEVEQEEHFEPEVLLKALNSRRRRLLAFHLKLERSGLPPSRLLSKLRSEARSSSVGRREQEVSASPQLRKGRVPEEGGSVGWRG